MRTIKKQSRWQRILNFTFESSTSIFKFTSSKKNDRRIDQFSIHIHESNDNRRFDKIID